MKASVAIVLLGLGASLAACGGADGTFLSGDSGAGGDDSSKADSGNSQGDANGGGDSSNVGDGPTAGDGAVFNIGGVSGLVLWLDAAKGVSSSGNAAVSAWADQSGNNNNASESRDALQPTLADSAINSLPAVRFAADAQASAGKDLLIASSNTLGWGTGDYLVEVVAQYDNTPQAQNLIAEQAVGYGELYTSIFGVPIDSASGVGLYANSPPIGGGAPSTAFMAFASGTAVSSMGTGYNNNQAHLFAMQRAGTTLSVRLDGAAAGSASLGAGTDVGATAGAHLGGIENATTQRLHGDIAEVIAVKGSISQSDLSGIEGYLRSKYALP